jgi:arylsulfatase A-like enzyme
MLAPMELSRRGILSMGAAPAALALQAQAPQPSTERPNILWICTDQQRWDTLTALGNPHIRTPHLDRLAASGVSFSRTYCQNPVCTPSRASFMTGCYPTSVHVHRNGNSHFPQEWIPRLAPRLFRDAGYDCALVGKLHLSSPFQRVEPRFDDGYRIFEWSHQPKPEPNWPVEQHAYHRWLRDKGVEWAKLYKARKIDGYPAPYQAGMPERYHEITWASQLAQSWMRGGVRKPWFASLHIFAPHPPFDPAPEYLERMKPSSIPEPLYRQGEEAIQARFQPIDHQTAKPVPPSTYAARHMKASYYAMVEHIDHEVGQMLDTLEATGQRDNTIVVFTSDHGEMLGDHCLRAKGCRFFEGAVRVPLLISWPGRFRKGFTSDALVELTDILPTLLEASGLPVPEHIDGKSLVKLLQGQPGAPTQHRTVVRSEYHDSLQLPGHSRATMIRDDRYKLVVYHGTGQGELFDLGEDPSEFNNLYSQPAGSAVQARMTAQMLDEIATHADLGQPRVGRY